MGAHDQVRWLQRFSLDLTARSLLSDRAVLLSEPRGRFRTDFERLVDPRLNCSEASLGFDLCCAMFEASSVRLTDFQAETGSTHSRLSPSAVPMGYIL